MSNLGIVTTTKSKQSPRSRVAILGTLADLHREPIQYDLKTLRRVVKELQPDLLCAEIYPEDWRAGDANRLSIEYREALVPLSRRTNIIIVPVGGSKEKELFKPRGGRWLGIRTFIVRLLNNQLRVMQRLANGPRVINSGPFGWMCDWMCSLTAWICGPQAQKDWDEVNQAIVGNILAAIRRDPGRRVLVTVNCRLRHRLEQRLGRVADIELVNYRSL